MSNPPLLQLEGLVAGPGPAPVLRGVDLTLAEGERAALLGRTGSGKTTLLRCIAGFLAPRSGCIRIGGQRVAADGVHVAPDRRGVSLVFQNYALWPHLTVRDHLRLVAPAKDGDKWLERLRLGPLAERTPGQLSGGEQARLALARSLAARPRLLLLDEPFRNLDHSLALELREELAGWFESEGLTVLLVTHQRREAFSLADTVHLLERGRRIAGGPPRTLYRHPGSEEAARLLGPVAVLPARAGSNGRLQTLLGEVEADGEGRGDRLLLRPENLEVRRDEAGNGTVVREHYEGGTVLLRVRVDDQDLLARSHSDGGWRAGERVRVRVRGKVSLLNGPGPEASA